MNQQDAFLQAIRENPDDDEVRLVFADWLEDQGDPRGELMRLQCQLWHLASTSTPREEPLRRREVQLRRKHSRQWKGSPGREVLVGYERGMLEVDLGHSAFQRDEVQQWWREHQPWITKVELGADTDEELDELFCHKLIKEVCWLDLWFLDVSSEAFENLPQLKKLRILSLDDIWEVDQTLFEIIADLHGLQRLEILQTSLIDAGFPALESLTNLRSLRFDFITSQGLANLGELTTLERLEIPWAQASKGQDYAPLTNLSNLKELEMSGPRINGLAMSHFAKLPSLKKMALRLQLNEPAMKILGSMAQLEVLSLQLEDNLPSQWLQHLIPLQVSELSLAYTDLSGTGLEHLAHLKQLRSLDLRETDLGSRDFRFLKSLTGLHELLLDGCPLTGKAVRHLTPLTELHSLSLNRTKVNDDAIPYLKELTNLKWLDLGNTKVTKNGIRALKRAIPALLVLR